MGKRHEKPPWKRIVTGCPFGGCITCDEQAERIQELEGSNHRAYLEGRSKGFEDGKRNADELEAENFKLRELLQDALPHISCNNASQSGLITEIGELLSKPWKDK